MVVTKNNENTMLKWVKVRHQFGDGHMSGRCGSVECFRISRDVSSRANYQDYLMTTLPRVHNAEIIAWGDFKTLSMIAEKKFEEWLKMANLSYVGDE